MKLITGEWVDKAESDYHTALREQRARTHPNYDAVCFHARQCAEKYLMARLIEAGIEFPKTHDLTRLLTLLQPIEPFWVAYETQLRSLTDYSVEFRYPGESANKEIAKKALGICKQIRALTCKSLELAS